MHENQEVIDAIQHYYNDPVAYAEEIEGVTLDPWQIEALEKLVTEHFLALRSGSGVGKTFLLGLASRWFLFTRPRSKVPSTAPSQHQLFDVLWSEHFKRISNSPILNNLFIWTQTRVGVKGHEPEWYAVARTAQVRPGAEVAEGLQGFHDEENILFIVDEACHDDQTEILTERGWFLFKDLQPDDKVLTLDSETGFAEYQEPVKYFKAYHKGPMFEMRSQTGSFCVTPNHEILYRLQNPNKPNKFSEWRRNEIQNIEHPLYYMKRNFAWRGVDEPTFVLPQYISVRAYEDRSEISLDMESWCEFVGWYLSEGNIQDNGSCVRISQYAEDNKEEIAVLTEVLGFEPHINVRSVDVYSVQLAAELSKYGGHSSNKCIPSYMKKLSPKYLKAFLRGYGLGDGYITPDGRYQYTTVSKKLADDVQEVLLKTGCCASITTQDRIGKVAENSKGGPSRSNFLEYRINEYVNTSDLQVSSYRDHINKVDYEGYVYCVQVPKYNLLFTRRDGFCVWSGNSGVPDAIFPAMEGSLTGDGSYCILAGNPTRTNGYFYDTFNNPALKRMYHHMHVSCYDSPRVGKRYIQMMAERYGENHPIFMIKVLGEFATGDATYLVPPSFLDTMENNSPPDVKGFPIEFGLDVGRARASSVLCIRQGNRVLKYDERHKKGSVTDTAEICQWTIEYINEFGPTNIKVDAIGIGAGVYDGLHDIYGDMIVPVVGSMAPEAEVKERYLNLRAQGYWQLREMVPSLYCEDWPNRVIMELGDIRTKPTSNLKIKIESKEDMLARAMKSPDYADATMYAFLSPDACRGVRAVVYEFPGNVIKNTGDMTKKSVWDARNFSPRSRRRRFDVQ